MGLGKTIEVIALVLSNPRTEANGGALTDRSRSRKIMNGMSEIDRPAVVKATLIICPLSIQQQWEDEILTHAPALKVFKYNGCSTIFVSVI